jgi:hypothetical protein
MTVVPWEFHRNRGAVFLKRGFENTAITLPAKTRPSVKHACWNYSI